MKPKRRVIEEHDVVRLLEPVERWPAGTEGTVVFVHSPDVMMVEMPGEADSCLDLLVDVPTELLEVTWWQGLRAAV
ncbi:MAG TPA: hypothetical protein VFF79_02350 [Conexibacter sp.]|jgi:hypothetical protein|nr:hypothetical protein [Conexibacter sp.]